MKDTKIIIVSGKKKTGKDTLSNLFVNQGYAQYAFADEVKFVCQMLLEHGFHFPVDKKCFEDQTLKNEILDIPFTNRTLTPRILMQTFGTEFVRNFISKDYWVDVIIDRIKRTHNRDKFIISDARFPNEIIKVKDYFKDLCDVYTIKVIRKTDENDPHDSETSLEQFQDWDYIVDNNYELPQLIANFKKIYKEIHKETI